MISSDKICINFCPTGMVPSKSDNQNVPISVSEIVDCTHEAYEIGITIAHLHARDQFGNPSSSGEIFHQIISKIRYYCPDLIICLSTSGRVDNTFEARSEAIKLAPDMCSLTLSSLNFINQASINSPSMIRSLLETMIKYGVHPELECFDLGMINYGKYLLNKYGLNNLKSYWNLIFGNIAGLQNNLGHMTQTIAAVPANGYIALGALGVDQLSVNATAIAHGYGVRVGLEDNLWMDREKKVPASNITLLKRIHSLIEINDKEYMKSKVLNLYNTNKCT